MAFHVLLPLKAPENKLPHTRAHFPRRNGDSAVTQCDLVCAVLPSATCATQCYPQKSFARSLVVTPPATPSAMAGVANLEVGARRSKIVGPV